MINRILVVIGCLFLITTASIGNDNKINTELLGDYIKIWGLVKYHQTPKAETCLNMDSIFINHIARLLNNPKKKEFEKAVNELIVKYENIENPIFQIENYQKTPFDLAILPDFTWVEHSKYLNDKQIALLKLISNDYLKDSSCYFVQMENRSHVNFINENNILQPFPDVETRILSLAKYWNMVYYFFAYKDLLSFNWESILPKYIIRIIEAVDSMEYHLAILELTILLEDSHVNTKSLMIDKFWGVYQVPISLTCYGNKAIVTGLLSDTIINNPFKIGDQVISINGKSFETEFQNVKHLVPGSNQSRKLFNYCNLFNRVQGLAEIQSKIVRLNDTLEIESNPIHIIDYGRASKEYYYRHQSSKLYNDSIGYIDPSQIYEDSVFQSISKLILTKYLIVDLRKYPNLILDTLCYYLFEKPTAVSNWFSPISNLPGYFAHREPIKKGCENINAYKGKVIVMVNAGSQSRAEFFTMAMQKTNKNITIGSQTSGADGNVTKFSLPGSIYSSFTGLGITYPNGDQTQKNGVRIDIEFNPSGNLVKDYRDEEFEFVINQILGGGIDAFFNKKDDYPIVQPIK